MSVLKSEQPCYSGIRDEAVEARVSELLRSLGDSLREWPEGQRFEVYLGGGYGRGEGGVRVTPTGERTLYNDLDFFVFTRGLRRAARGRLDAALRSLGASLVPRAGVEVDFGPAKDMGCLRREGRSLMYQELRVGHVLVHGCGEAMGQLPVLAPGELSPHEGIRLLWNRGMGLLLAGLGLCGDTRYDLDFILRNLHKAALGAGDAALLRLGRYAWSGAERVALVEKLAELGWASEERSRYRLGYEFKLRPCACAMSPEALGEDWTRVTGLWCRELERHVGASGDGAEESDFLRLGCRNGSRGVRQGLRWLRRTGWRGICGGLFVDPVYRLLYRLHRVLGQGWCELGSAAPELSRLWHYFT